VKKQVLGEEHNRDGAPQGFEMPDMERPLTTFSLIETLALIAISLKGGEMLALCSRAASSSCRSSSALLSACCCATCSPCLTGTK
jgi:sodium--glutamate symport carrier gltS